MRLYNAICGWLEAHAAQMQNTDGPHPEGNNFAYIEKGDVFPERPELHPGYSRQSIDDDDGGTYRAAQPISMRWTPKT